MKLRDTIFLSTMLAVLQACSGVDPRIGEIDALCSGLFPDGEPGAAVLIMEGDSILFEKGYGIADLGTGAPIDPATSFNIASVSKQFTAVAILQLAEKGLLSLDDPVGKYFPEYGDPLWNKVSIKHLLSHSSGIPDERGYLTREEKVAGDEDLAVEYMKTLDHLRFEPGTAYEYINPTFVLAGKIVERVTGEPFTEYVTSHIFSPAGMDRTVYFDRDRQDLIPSMAHGYEYSEEKGGWYEYDFGEETFFATRPDGGIYTSVKEFAKWELALRKNLVMSAESAAEAMSPITLVSGSPWSDYQNRPNTWYGYGWFVEPATGTSPERVYHTGDNGGFKIIAARYPEKEILVLVFANRSDWDRYGLLMDLERIIFGRKASP